MGIPVHDHPFSLFEAWLDEARQRPEITEPTAMTLATVDASGQPWSRVVLLKDLAMGGFAFYTNLGSPKAQQVIDHPYASLCFYWMPLKRQVRASGTVAPVSDEEADAYFASRPRDSQLGAWASKQSEHLTSRDALENRFAEVRAQYEGKTVPRPAFWSGFRVTPSEIEFWEGRDYRLHDRLLYTATPEGGWETTLLFP